MSKVLRDETDRNVPKEVLLELRITSNMHSSSDIIPITNSLLSGLLSDLQAAEEELAGWLDLAHML